jgi:hypothetical protein
MKQIFSRRRAASNVSESAQQHLSTYAPAAVVAVLILLALTEPSEARIVYTPTNVQVDNPYNLDLNHDGITDFTLQQNHTQRGGFCGESLWDSLVETPAQGNSVAVASGFPAALRQGVEIGPGRTFGSNPDMETVERIYFLFYHHCLKGERMFGPWLNVSNRYLGLEFQIKGKTHYGWARLSVQVGYVYINATLTGYAYETIPNKSIIAGQTKGAADEWDEESFVPSASLSSPISNTPQPTSFGMFALGAQIVPLWRRKEPL